MKKLSSLLLAIIVTSSVFVFDSCKKGDEDPFLTIQSRKARVTGDWTLNSDNKHTETLDQNGSTTIEDFVISGTSINITTETKNSAHDTIITVGTSEDGGEVLQSLIKFEKDGTFSSKLEYKIIVNDKTDITDTWQQEVTVTTVTLIERSGTWNFMAGVEKQWKNKERIVVVLEQEKRTVTETTVTQDEINGIEQDPITENHKYDYINNYANDEMGEVWALLMLKGKEIKMYRDIDNYTNTVVDGISGQTVSNVGTHNRTLKQ